MVLYLILCLVSVLAGCGILTLIGVDVERRSTIYLAPFATLGCLVLSMGGLLAGHLTVGQITPAIYLLSIASAIFGAIRHGKIVLTCWRSQLLLAGLPLLVLLPAILEGIENYSGGMCMDGWAYVTAGQSLQDYPLGAEGWLPLNVQYSSVYVGTRYISIAFLGLLAPLTGAYNDTQEALGPYFGWLLFVYGSACVFFAKAVRLSRSLTWMFLILVMLSGWSLKIINANSVDNALALCFLPVVFGILILMPAASMRLGIALGAIVAVGLYAYPESSPFTIAALLAMAAQKLVAQPAQLLAFRRMGVAFLLTVGACILPRGLEISNFFRAQFNSALGAAGSRPGESLYTSLAVKGYMLSGYWGLSLDGMGQQYFADYYRYATVLACLLTLSALAGMVLLLWRRNWSLPLFAAASTTAYIVFLVHFRYSYAAYKVLVLSWFALTYLVVAGAEWVWKTLQSFSKNAAFAGIGIGIGLVAAVGGFFVLQERVFYDSLPYKSVREVKKVATLQNLASGQPVAMLVDQTFANIWGVHFLRKTKLYLAGQYRGYMPSFKETLLRTEPVDSTAIRYVVTDNSKSFGAERLLYQAGPYYIWDCGSAPWTLVTEIDNPFGLDGGSVAEPYFWIAKARTELQVLSRKATTAIITAEFFSKPGGSEASPQRVRLATAHGFQEERTIRNGMHSFAVPLQAGLNRVLVRSIEKVPLLIRGSRLSVSVPTGNNAQISDIESPNEFKNSFFWMDQRAVTVTISAAEAGTVHLSAKLVPGPALENRSKARLSISSPSGTRIEQDLDVSSGQAKLSIPVLAGQNRIELRAIGPSRLPGPPGGSRSMMIGLRNLEVSPLE